MNYEQLNGISIREGFNRFNKENPSVYLAFEKQAIRAIKMGRKKLSAKLIINWIRWNRFLNTTDENFKINDAYHSYYARYFIKQHPEYAGIFEMRKLRNEIDGQYMNVDESGQLSFI